jgi:hypothetical protein
LPLGVWLRSHYLLFLGEGFIRLGREQVGVEALNEAIRFSEANQIHQIAFKAQAELAEARSDARGRPATPPSLAWVPDDVDTVVRAISDLRKAALAA